MGRIEELVDYYEKKLTNEYLRANTKSKRKKLVRDLIAFKEICTERFELDKTFAWECDTEILKLTKSGRVSFIKEVANNGIMYNEIFTNTLNIFIEEHFPLYKYYQKNYQKLTLKEAQELIFDFLNHYDEKLLKGLKNKMDGDELFCGPLMGYKGTTYSFGSININLMFYTPEYGCNIDSASTIIHEFGHSVEMDAYYKVGKTNYFDIIRGSPYYEISSRFLEYSFLNYLKENNILVDEVNKRMHRFLFNLLVRSYEIMMIYRLEQIEIDELDNVYIVDDSIKEEAEEIQKKINYYSLQSSPGDVFKYRHSFLYGIGTLSAIVLYEKYKEDPKYFKKEFVNASLTYPNKGLPAFENVGLTRESMTDNAPLRRILRNSR